VSNQELNLYNKNRFEGKSSGDPEMDWLFEKTGMEAPAPDVDAAWARLNQKLGQKSVSRGFQVPVFFRVAAAFVLLAVFVFILHYQTNEAENQVALVTKQTEDSRMGVKLPDGSRVVLNYQSLLQFPETFGESREVSFKGEAYFDIIKNPEKPFVIDADGVEVRILGTAFNLVTTAETVSVFVERGTVAFARDGELIKMEQGVEGTYNRANQSVVLNTTPSLNVQSWRNGKFEFNNTPLAQVVEDLSSYYHINFVLTNANLETCRVTAKFDNAPLADVLSTLETILGVSIQRTSNEVRIKGKGCQ
jgi:transmembrane sensor